MNTLAQIIGIGLVISISASALFIALDEERWYHSGRVALVTLAGYQLVFVFSRIMRLTDWWSGDTAFTFNTLMAGAFAAVLANILFLQRTWRKRGLTIDKQSI